MLLCALACCWAIRVSASQSITADVVRTLLHSIRYVIIVKPNIHSCYKLPHLQRKI